MAFTLGSDIFGSIDTMLNTTMASGVVEFASLIAPLIGACVSLYFVLKAFGWITAGSHHQELPVGDFIKQMAYMALFTLYAFNTSHYFQYVVEPVNSIGNEISAAFSVTDKSAPQVIDQMGNQIIDTISLIWEMSPDMSVMDMNLVPILRAITTIVIVALGGTIFMGLSFCYLVIAKVMMGLVLCLGPIFISAVFFPTVRQFFTLWLNQLINYILLTALFGITFTMLTNLLQQYVSGTDFSDVLVTDQTQLKLLFAYVVFCGVITAIPQLASSLSGGVGINGLGGMGSIAGMAGGGVKALMGALKGAAKTSGNSIKGGADVASAVGGAIKKLG